eukprot:TRINITY_DN9095_c0_g2_i1.p1 TRINITY_DN9095_c0_g2~~TRINITY_DN9095_c0_g2_i1.p1  ORF type:complete len:308 (+),score=67.96 TRINITY_DN9095_c0_g2_i1:77-1000(+)
MPHRFRQGDLPSPAPSSSGSPRHSMPSGVEGQSAVTRQLQAALEGHYSGWQQSQREKVEKFVSESLAAGLESFHEPARWGQGSVRFLSEDDDTLRPSWHSHDAAVREIHQMIVDCLAARGVRDGYRLEHAERDFAKGYRPFVSFRLCCDEERSVERWRARQAERSRLYVSDALRLMIEAAAQGNAEVWAKIPSGRYSNFLTKDEPWPTWLGRDRAVHEIRSIVISQLEASGLEAFELEVQGGPMSGVWFRVSHRIERPRSVPAVAVGEGRRKGYGSVRSAATTQMRRSSASSVPRQRVSMRGASHVH